MKMLFKVWTIQNEAHFNHLLYKDCNVGRGHKLYKTYFNFSAHLKANLCCYLCKQRFGKNNQTSMLEIIKPDWFL